MGGFVVWEWRPAVPAQKEPTFDQVTTVVPENRATAAAISPDAKATAYANIDGIFVRTNQNAEPSPLRAPADFIVDRLTWFPDGTRLLASGFSTAAYAPVLWEISISGAIPRLLRTHARGGIPSPDGTHIAFITEGRSEIWTMETDGEQARKIVTGPEDVFLLVF